MPVSSTIRPPWRWPTKWVGGEVASADGLRFVTPVRTLNAGPNRKYFGADRGITYYNFTSDQYTGFHGIVVPGTLRDSILYPRRPAGAKDQLEPDGDHGRYRWCQ